MTGADRLLVVYGRAAVAIDSNDAALSADLARTFRYLRGHGEPTTTLAVSLDGTAWRVAEQSGVPVVRASRREAIRAVRQRILEIIIGAHPELVWLHGAAVEWEGAAVLLVGARGRGKSTLASELCRRGAGFLTDDILPLEPTTLRVRPFPRVPEVRPDPGAEMPESWLLDVEKTEVDVRDRLAATPLAVRAIVIPRSRRGGGVALEPCSAGEAAVEIASGCWNFADHGTRAAAVLSTLVRGMPVTALAFDSGEPAGAELVTWLRSALPPRR